MFSILIYSFINFSLFLQHCHHECIIYIYIYKYQCDKLNAKPPRIIGGINPPKFEIYHWAEHITNDQWLQGIAGHSHVRCPWAACHVRFGVEPSHRRISNETSCERVRTFWLIREACGWKWKSWRLVCLSNLDPFTISITAIHIWLCYVHILHILNHIIMTYGRWESACLWL